MANRIMLECWNDQAEEGEILIDYDEECESIGMVMKMLDATQRISFSAKDLLTALKQLWIKEK